MLWIRIFLQNGRISTIHLNESEKHPGFTRSQALLVFEHFRTFQEKKARAGLNF